MEAGLSRGARAATGMIWLATTAAAALAAPAAAATPAARQPPAGAPGAATSEQALLDKLRERVDAVDAGLDGVLGLYVEDLSTGLVIERRADVAFPAASSIKLAILYELYRQADEGRLDLGELTRPPVPRVGGGGVLQALGAQVSLTWRDLAVLMMGWSDNEATNLLIRRVGLESVDRRLDALSLPRTRLRRRMMDLEAARRGDENVSTPRELARLASIVARGEGLDAGRARDLLAVATTPDGSSPFRRGLPESQKAVSKPGSLEGVRCEAAWVELPGRPYAAAVMTSFLAHDDDGERAISELSAAIYQTFDRLARSSGYGRVISPR
jgi:beta-lactamase class A